MVRTRTVEEAVGVAEPPSRGRAPRRGALSDRTTVEESAAYREGWRDGRFSPSPGFAGNPSLAAWEGHDRLAYYRGYRDGLRVREMLAGG